MSRIEILNTAKANGSTLTSEVTNGAVMDTPPGGL